MELSSSYQYWCFVNRGTIHWWVNEEACLAEDRDRYKDIKCYVFCCSSQTFATALMYLFINVSESCNSPGFTEERPHLDSR